MLRVLILMFIFSLIAGCGVHGKTSKKINYKQAITLALHHSQQTYVPVKLGPYHGNYPQTDPLIKTLAQQGIIVPVKISAAKLAEYDIAGYHHLHIPAIEFEPTAKGKSLFRQHCHELGLWKFCIIEVRIGTAKLLEYHQQSPIITKSGVTKVQFKYYYYIKPYHWFQQLLLTKPNSKYIDLNTLQAHFGSKNHPYSAKITLYLTKKGWSE